MKIPQLIIASTLFISAFALDFDFDFEKFDPSQSAPPPHIHSRFAYVTWSKDKGYEIKTFGFTGEQNEVHSNLEDVPDDLDWVAKARYQNFINKTGWGFVEVETKPKWSDDKQAHASGIAEGYLTRDLIYYFYQNSIQNYCNDPERAKLCKFIYKFVQQNVDWMESATQQQKDKDPYWHQMDLIREQFAGLYEGYNYNKGNSINKAGDLTQMDIVFMNILGDLGDIQSALSGRTKMRDGHCSALIKVIDNKDIYASHVTWAGLESMLRLIKRYNFNYHMTSDPASKKIPGESISMSSYPGMLYSMDDYYLISSGLLVTETTIMNYNKDLWQYVNPKNTLFVAPRVMIANRLAENGLQWTKIFSKFNSGTYNNQWMVLDYNRFEPGKKLNDGLLYVLEQMPGNVVAKDVTQVLRDQGYWSSFNIPYFQEIFEASGHPKQVKKYGEFFTFDGTPRSKIFKRDQDKVTDLDSMMKLMRYNDYQNDPLSRCNCTPGYSAVAAISSRGDLNPSDGSFPFPILGHRQSASTDMKLTNLDMFLLQRFVAIGGPTYDPLPPFQWSKASPDIQKLPHFGMPDKYEFEPMIHQWKWL